MQVLYDKKVIDWKIITVTIQLYTLASLYVFY